MYSLLGYDRFLLNISAPTLNHAPFCLIPKVVIEASKYDSYEFSDTIVQEGSPINADMHVNAYDRFLYVMTTRRVSGTIRKTAIRPPPPSRFSQHYQLSSKVGALIWFTRARALFFVCHWPLATDQQSVSFVPFGHNQSIEALWRHHSKQALSTVPSDCEPIKSSHIMGDSLRRRARETNTKRAKSDNCLLSGGPFFLSTGHHSRRQAGHH